MNKKNFFGAAICIIFLGLGSIPAQADANFQGHWQASSGKVSSNVGLHSDCSKVEIIIEQDEGHLIVKKYAATCTAFGSDWGPVAMEIREHKVYEQGEQTGTISENTLLTVSQDGGAAYAFNLKLITGADGAPALQSYYGVKNGVGAIATEATMQKMVP